MRAYNFLLILFSCILTVCKAEDYSKNLYKYSFPNQQSFLESLKEDNKDFCLNLKKEYREYYTEQTEKLCEKIENHEFIHDQELYTYIDKIFNHIKTSNDQLVELKTRFLVSREPWPNAASVGDGTFIINIDLIRKIQNEAQLAFIFCHELAHFYLKHTEQRIDEHIEKYESASFKSEVRKISRSQYNRTGRLQELLQTNLYDQRKHERQEETEADSIGMMFFTNTQYPLIEAMTSMNLLDTIDYYKFREKIDFKRLFTTPDQPFRSRWLEVEQTMFSEATTEAEYFDRDSIKTHPDCSERAVSLRRQIIGKQAGGKQYIISKDTLERIKKNLDREYINSWMFRNDYSSALFYTLKHLQSEPQNLFIKQRLGSIFFKIHSAQADHKLSRYIYKPSLDFEEEFNICLEFIDNIRLSELANIAFHMLKSETALKDEASLFYKAYFSKRTNNIDDYVSFRNQYIDLFPTGRFKEQIDKL